MSYEIVTKYIKDLNFKIEDAKSYFLLEKDIKNYTFVCDIKSKKLKEKIIQVDVNLRLIPVDQKSRLFPNPCILDNPIFFFCFQYTPICVARPFSHFFDLATHRSYTIQDPT